MIQDDGYTPGRDTVAVELPEHDWVVWNRPVVALNELSLRIRINNLSDAGINIDT